MNNMCIRITYNTIVIVDTVDVLDVIGMKDIIDILSIMHHDASDIIGTVGIDIRYR